jgi:Flp pilus assembly protein TadG
MIRSCRKLWREERAAAMVEFAIIAPLLFLLVFAITDYGRYFYLYARFSNVARTAARQGSVQPIDPLLADNVRARVLTELGNSGVSESMITVTAPAIGSGTTGPSTVRVTIRGYPFSQVTPFVPIPDSIPSVTAEYRHEFR